MSIFHLWVGVSRNCQTLSVIIVFLIKFLSIDGKPEISGFFLTDLQMYKIHVRRLAKCFNANTCLP